MAILIGIFLPESPRYLVQNKKFHKAFIIIKKIWIINNKKEKRSKSSQEGTIEHLLKRNDAEFFNLNTSIIQKFDQITNEKSSPLINNSSFSGNLKNIKKENSTNAMRYLFKSKANFFKTAILSYVLFSTTLSYFGIFCVPFFLSY